MFTLTWQQYADWLISIQGYEPEYAVEVANQAYANQYKRYISPEHVQKFLEDRDCICR